MRAMRNSLACCVALLIASSAAGQQTDPNREPRPAPPGNIQPHQAPTFEPLGPQPQATAPNTVPQDVIVVPCTQDFYNVNAQYSVAVDGVVLSQTGTCITSGGPTAAPTTSSFLGTWGPATHTLKITFLNDQWGGSSSKDLNLYIHAPVQYDGLAAAILTAGGSSAQIDSSNGMCKMYVTGDWCTWRTQVVPTPPNPTPPQTITVTLGPVGITLTCNQLGSYTIGPLTLSCSAVGTAHSVTLTWSPVTTCISNGVSSPCTPTGYNTYRGTATGGPYSMVGTSSTASFTDLAIVSGNTYYYVVTAYLPGCVSGSATACGESTYSNEVNAVVPNP